MMKKNKTTRTKTARTPRGLKKSQRILAALEASGTVPITPPYRSSPHRSGDDTSGDA